MANTNPTLAYPTQTIFHWLALGPPGWLWKALRRMCKGLHRVYKASCRVFRYQHVGIGNTKWWRWGYKPTRRPNTNGFALQWNIGLNCHAYDQSIRHMRVSVTVRIPGSWRYLTGGWREVCLHFIGDKKKLVFHDWCSNDVFFVNTI